MPLEMFVVSETSADISKIIYEDYEELDVLSSRTDAIGIQLRELIESVRKSVEGSIESEGELSLEISGAVELKASAGGQYLFFNIGGSASKNNTMKVSFKTKVSPKST